MLLIASAAWAQSVPNGDFEIPDFGWQDTSIDCFDPLDGLPPYCSPTQGFAYDGTTARGTAAGRLDQAYLIGSTWLFTGALSEPFVVTRTRLSWAQTPDILATAWLDGYGGPLLAGSPSTDGFTHWERDLSAACGELAQVRLEATDGGPFWFDDVALVGDVCPDFLDADGDGFCPRGTDTDGDGDCAEAGELAGADCDDTDPLIGACLELDFGRWVKREVQRSFQVGGLGAGQEVFLVAGEAPGFSCPAALSGACADLADPVTVLGSALADAYGQAEIVVTIPGWTTFAPRLFQAVSSSARSPVEQGWILPRNPNPRRGPEPGVVNGNMNSNLGWPPDSWGFDLGWYSFEHESCPAATYVTEPARGPRALAVGTTDPQAASFCNGLTHGWPLLVTRSNLRWISMGNLELDVLSMEDGAVLPLTVAGPVHAEDGFDEFVADLSDACGTMVRIDLANGSYLPTPAVVDQLRLVGPPCPQYSDPDGDGLCPSGTDLDGDGACVSLHEPDPLPGDPVLPIERMLVNFESDPAPTDMIVTEAEVAPLSLPGDRSAYLDPAYVSDWYALPGEVVTHDTLVVSASTQGVGDWPTARFSLGISRSSTWLASLDSGLFAKGPGRWSQLALDLSSVCGQTFDAIEVSLNPFDDWTLDPSFDPYAFDNPEFVLLDRLGFAGAPCPTLLDTDGDGACREGLDLDGDGLCVTSGEPTPGTVQDPDE